MKRMVSAICASFALAFFAATPAFADGPGQAQPDRAAAPVRAAPVNAPPPAPVQPRTGEISLMNGAITLNVPSGYKFYSAEEAYAFLQRNGAPPPNGTVLGLVAPASTQIDRPGVWATVISYDELGYVRTDTVGDLGEPNFEADVRDARAAQNRPFEGFSLSPSYEATNANLSWAERAAAPGAGGRDLRHEQRLLARRGVVGLTTIGSADQMGAITNAAPTIARMVRFPQGDAYGDFNAATDTISQYSVPGLITGVPETDPNLLAETASADTVDTQAAGLFSGGGLMGLFPWIAGGVVVLAGAGYLFFRRRGGSGDEPDLEADEA